MHRYFPPYKTYFYFLKLKSFQLCYDAIFFFSNFIRDLFIVCNKLCTQGEDLVGAISLLHSFVKYSESYKILFSGLCRTLLHMLRDWNCLEILPYMGFLGTKFWRFLESFTFFYGVWNTRGALQLSIKWHLFSFSIQRHFFMMTFRNW